MRLFLLPAFDGTGKMFNALRDELANDFDTIPIVYPEEGPQDYESLSNHIREQLPNDEDYILLGESFAGPIIYRLACKASANCKAAVFVATYLRNPQPFFLKILTLFPASVLSWFVSSPLIVRLLSLSKHAKPTVGKAIAENFASVKPSVIKQRLLAISRLNDKPEDKLEIPCLYIKASKDKLVLKNRLPDFERLCKNLTIVHARGGHFVIQENPQDCAGILRNHLNT